MERQQLTANLRQKTGKGVARQLRAKGAIPAVLYGQGQEAMPLSVDTRDFTKVVSSASGINVIVDLQIEGKDRIPVMVKDYQAHVIDRKFLHVDFLKVDLSKKVSVEVPIQLVGKAPGVKEGGILEHITRTIKVNCLPTAIPNALEADVSGLNIGDNIHVHDLKLPEGVELVPGSDETVAAVVAPVEEVVTTPATEVVQPEVLTEKKPAEGEGEKKVEKKEEKKK
ncbi:MAG: 50S ribosomal protein L25/general stress protein Ctc [Deltaproteobacteria bacterium]|nr:50S ribosomal protein L25/general stress protein Ctc [Deltaproteobacteria bacterium]